MTHSRPQVVWFSCVFALLFSALFTVHHFAFDVPLRLQEKACRLQFEESGIKASLALENTSSRALPAQIKLEMLDPSGYVRARVLDVKVVDGVGARIVVSRGPSQGVLPGAKAYLVTAKGHPANNGAFTIAHALSNRAVAGTIPHTTVDNVLAHQDVFVEAGKPCQAPSPVELDGAQLFAASKGTIPAGWAVVPVPRERSAWPEFHVGKGAKDGPFWNEAPDRVSDMLAYLTYVAWYIDIYEAGPSASYEQFVSGIRLVGLKIERDQSDIRWIVDVTLKKTPIDFMSSDERQTFANILSRGRG